MRTPGLSSDAENAANLGAPMSDERHLIDHRDGDVGFVPEAPRTYVRGIYPLQALERLSPKRGIRYSSTD